jgi:hypothetical protein
MLMIMAFYIFRIFRLILIILTISYFLGAGWYFFSWQTAEALASGSTPEIFHTYHLSNSYNSENFYLDYQLY